MRDIANAHHYSEALGNPLTAMITLHWSKTKDFRSDLLGPRMASFIKRMNSWLKHRNIPPTWIYVHENSHRAREHTHFNLHLPREYLEDLQWSLHHLMPGYRNVPNTFLISRDYYGKLQYKKTLKARAGHARYILKGLDHDSGIGELIDVRRKEGMANQGFIPCRKRYGLSHSLRKTTRLKHGFIDVTDWQEIRAILNPSKAIEPAANAA